MAWLLTLAPPLQLLCVINKCMRLSYRGHTIKIQWAQGGQTSNTYSNGVNNMLSLFYYLQSFSGENSLKIPSSSWLFSAFYSTKFFASVWNFSTTFHNWFFISRAEGLMCICIFSSTEIPLQIVWYPQTKRKKGDATMLQHFKGMLCFSSIETHSGCFHRHRAIASKK